MLTLTSFGAARTVTGSKHLLDTGTHKILVDCGQFQGLKELRERNWQPLPMNVDAVILTHAHLDHCGLLPRLVQQGFRGRIFCTQATAELTKVVLALGPRCVPLLHKLGAVAYLNSGGNWRTLGAGA